MKVQNRSSRGAFTLVEILVVLVIMGFLVAMVAPKLSGIVSSAVDTACDTNQERLRKVLNVFTMDKGGLPNGLTNMVMIQGATDLNATDETTAAIPLASDGDKSNGAEFLSSELVERFIPQIHFLSEDEANELKDKMSIRGLKTFARVDNINAANGNAMDVIEKGINTQLMAGIPVMMAGVGMNSAGTTAVWGEGSTLTVTESNATVSDTALAINGGTAANANYAAGAKTFTLMPEAQMIGRIVLGVGNDGELVQTGVLEESGTCPGQLQHADHFQWGNYMVIVPRLASTIDRIKGATTGSVNWKMHAVALEEQDDGTYKIKGRTPNAGHEHFGAQSLADFTTSCPEGHTWGSNADAYGVVIK